MVRRVGSLSAEKVVSRFPEYLTIRLCIPLEAIVSSHPPDYFLDDVTLVINEKENWIYISCVTGMRRTPGRYCDLNCITVAAISEDTSALAVNRGSGGEEDARYEWKTDCRY